MARKAEPDFAVNSDHGSGTTAAKQARVMGVDVFTQRGATRTRLRDLVMRPGPSQVPRGAS